MSNKSWEENDMARKEGRQQMETLMDDVLQK